MLLRAENLAKSFPAVGAASDKFVLEDVSFTVENGERVGLIGPSGCGKTTLLSLIAGLEKLDHGHIERGDDNRLAFMFQEPRLLPWRSVAQNLELVLADDHDPAQISAMLEAVGLADAGNVYASRLSLGMARRVALARSFIIEPRLLLMDEPFVSLDAANALRLRRLLLDLLTRQQAGMLFVTHDIREAITVCDRILFLTPAPARILFETRIDLDAADRFDETAVERVRGDLIREHRLDAASLEMRARN